MSDENSDKPGKPERSDPPHAPEPSDPIEDVRKGLGLLFRAAKSTLEQLPTRQFEEAVVSGAREVGRAIENVTGAIDKQIFKREAGSATGTPASAGESTVTEAKAEPSAEAKPESAASDKDKSEPKSQTDGEPRGPRVG
jgi:hypothetical protein